MYTVHNCVIIGFIPSCSVLYMLYVNDGNMECVNVIHGLTIRPLTRHIYSPPCDLRTPVLRLPCTLRPFRSQLYFDLDIPPF